MLYAEIKGVAKLVCKDRLLILLLNILLVLKLGINLLSAKRLCEKGLKGSFNANSIKLKRDSKTIVKAKITNRLYVVTHIANGF